MPCPKSDGSYGFLDVSPFRWAARFSSRAVSRVRVRVRGGMQECGLGNGHERYDTAYERRRLTKAMRRVALRRNQNRQSRREKKASLGCARRR